MSGGSEYGGSGDFENSQLSKETKSKMVFEICFIDIAGVGDFSAHFNKWHSRKIFLISTFVSRTSHIHVTCLRWSRGSNLFDTKHIVRY